MLKTRLMATLRSIAAMRAQRFCWIRDAARRAGHVGDPGEFELAVQQVHGVVARASQRLIARNAGHADDRVPGFVRFRRPVAYAFAKGALARPVEVGDSLIDDGDERVLAIAVIEIAALQYRYTEGLEVSGRGYYVVDDRRVLQSEDWPALSSETVAPTVKQRDAGGTGHRK